jgi:hypothetical protein
MTASIIADRFEILRKIARERSMEFGNEDSLLLAVEDLKILFDFCRLNAINRFEFFFSPK